jgi:signal transduction histidine kinase
MVESTSGEVSRGLARTLRHEVGDFLQKVYASVAILQTTLPAGATKEREILARLRRHGEQCKELLDAVQDFLCPVELAPQPLDLAEAAAGLVRQVQPQFPELEISAEPSGAVWVTADPERVRQVGRMLLANACEAARGRVRIETRPGEGGGAHWCITDDGPGVAAEFARRLFTPFSSTKAGHAGLGLALARKLVGLHGGEVQLNNLHGGGCEARVSLPDG